MMFTVRVTASTLSPWLLKLFLWKNDGRNVILGIWKWHTVGLWGLLWFCLTSHQLSASTRFCCVEISLPRSLTHPALIILSQVHLPYRRLHCERVLLLLIFWRRGYHAIWCARDSTFLPRGFGELLLFLVSCLAPTNIIALRREMEPTQMLIWHVNL